MEEIEQAADGTGETPAHAEAVSMKFKDVGQLWKAYQSLEAEFTRKCQRLAELERRERTSSGIPAADQAEAPAPRSEGAGGAPGKQPSAGDLPGRAGTRGTEDPAGTGEGDLLRDSGFLPEIREAVIREFLNSVGRSAPAEASLRGGRTVSSPPRRPESFAEAGELFLKHLKGE